MEADAFSLRIPLQCRFVIATPDPVDITSLIDGLNDRQREAVSAPPGNYLVTRDQPLTQIDEATAVAAWIHDYPL